MSQGDGKPMNRGGSFPGNKGAGISVSPLLVDCARREPDEVFKTLETSATGLSQLEVERRIEQYGPNEVAQERERGWVWRLLMACRNPLVILLTALAAVSLATGDVRAAVVMALMVLLGVGLRFIQEARADKAAAKLKAMIRVTATAMRDGQAKELPLRELVPGDVIKLSAGDMIPADVRIISSKDLFIIQASLTGESLPVEKHARETRQNISPIELCDVCFLGTSVESGTATAVAVATGSHTFFGSMAKSIAGQQIQTAFDKGINRFTWLMIRFMMVMVPLVFLINGLTKHDWWQAFFFAMAVAVARGKASPTMASVVGKTGAMARPAQKTSTPAMVAD